MFKLNKLAYIYIITYLGVLRFMTSRKLMHSSSQIKPDLLYHEITIRLLTKKKKKN